MVRYFQIVSRLINNDVDVDVYTMHWSKFRNHVVHGESGDLRFHAICPKISMYHKERRSIFQALCFAFSSFSLLFIRCDVIEADYTPFFQLFPLRVVATLKRVPLVVTWHEVWGKSYWVGYLGWRGKIGALIERLCVHIPSIIITPSNLTATRLVALGADSKRVSVVKNAVDVDGIRNSTVLDVGIDLLYAGRLIENKRVDVAIKALKVLIDKGYNLRLGIVGVGPEEERLKTICINLGIQKNVEFFGEVGTQIELWGMLKSAKVFLFPSEREGFGLMVAESLVAGVPVVTSDSFDNLSKLLINDKETGSLVKSGDVYQFSIAVENWLLHPTTPEMISEKFLSRNPDFDWNSAAKSYLYTLHSLL